MVFRLLPEPESNRVFRNCRRNGLVGCWSNEDGRVRIAHYLVARGGILLLKCCWRNFSASSYAFDRQIAGTNCSVVIENERAGRLEIRATPHQDRQFEDFCESTLASVETFGDGDVRLSIELKPRGRESDRLLAGRGTIPVSLVLRRDSIAKVPDRY